MELLLLLLLKLLPLRVVLAVTGSAPEILGGLRLRTAGGSAVRSGWGGAVDIPGGVARCSRARPRRQRLFNNLLLLLLLGLRRRRRRHLTENAEKLIGLFVRKGSVRSGIILVQEFLEQFYREHLARVLGIIFDSKSLR